MLINYNALAATLRKKKFSLYILCGQEPYLLNEAAVQIKASCRQQGEWDEKILHINNVSDWTQFLEEANSYALFADSVLLDVRLDKKNLDAAAKKTLKHYIEDMNSRSVVLLRFPNVAAKELQVFSAHELVLLVQVAPLSAPVMQTWIGSQLQARSIPHEKEIPAMIHKYTQGNMLACAQVIERLALTQEKHEVLTVHTALEQLSDQCEFQLYELSEVCLLGNAEKAIQLVRYALQHRIEATLVLWLLTQEIRQLILLSQLLKQSLSFNEACSQLKIWSSRVKHYQIALKRLTLQQLYLLLQKCSQIDAKIKTGQGQPIWQALEQLSLCLCSALDFVI